MDVAQPQWAASTTPMSDLGRKAVDAARRVFHEPPMAWELIWLLIMKD